MLNTEIIAEIKKAVILLANANEHIRNIDGLESYAEQLQVMQEELMEEAYELRSMDE